MAYAPPSGPFGRPFPIPCTPGRIGGIGHDHAAHGRRDRLALLDSPRPPLVARAAASVGTTQAAGASLACAQTPHGRVVRGPRLDVDLPPRKRKQAMALSD